MGKKQKSKGIRDKIFNELNCLKTFIPRLDFRTYDINCIISVGSEEVRNRIYDQTDIVKATNWFGDYLYFISITIKQIYEPTSPIDECFSANVSFFQRHNGEIYQIFRADWDSYPSDTSSHPQPHWHLADMADNKDNISELYKELDSDYEGGIYDQLEDDNVKKDPQLNLHRIHFAMAGDWHKTKENVLPLQDLTDLTNWLMNLFNHVESELKYKDKRGFK